MSKDFSVIIPCFDAHLHVRNCIISILDGSVSNDTIEILIEPDDMSDYSWLVTEFPNVKVARTGFLRSGPGRTRNRALERATGKWVSYVDADDTVEPGFLAELVGEVQHDGVALAQTRIIQGREVLADLFCERNEFDFTIWQESGASARGLWSRKLFPLFANDVSQDIFHTCETLLRCNKPLRVSGAVYNLMVRENSETTSFGFAAKLDTAYKSYKDILLRNYHGHRLLEQAQRFFDQKIAMNNDFRTAGHSQPFYKHLTSS